MASDVNRTTTYDLPAVIDSVSSAAIEEMLLSPGNSISKYNGVTSATNIHGHDPCYSSVSYKTGGHKERAGECNGCSE